MKKYCFIDCGTHVGEAIKEFNQEIILPKDWTGDCFDEKKRIGYNFLNNNAWDVYTFEANPEINLHEIFKNKYKNLNISQQAVWIEDGYIEFKSQHEQAKGKIKNRNFQGDTSHINSNEVRQDDWRCFKNEPTNNKISRVSCMDFSNFLFSLKGKYNRVICKMDIEGAEVKVLEHCINQGSIDIIDDLYIELHERFKYPRRNDCGHTPNDPAHIEKARKIKEAEDKLINIYKKHISGNVLREPRPWH
tara:strand:+ start:683 stop:1423 length:741 start_codon:yes stop_codon:yes gene_type:complete